MKTLKYIFESNKEWAEKIAEEEPDFFETLSKTQNPEYLWIGCSDSRVPANEIIGRRPGEVFVHRNIANMVLHADMNCLSVIQYAVEILRVKHIIVCGHYDCGGIRAALEKREHGLIDNWLRHVKDVYRFYKEEIENEPDNEAMCNRLCELNIVEQVSNVCHTTIVQNAWESGQELSVHGWIYSLKDGLLRDLNVTASAISEISAIHRMHK